MRTCHIAIIDDDEALRTALSDLLRSMGVRISLFESADEFLDQADRREFAGVISDVQMPGTNGFDLARTLGADDHPLPVILITARPDVHFDDEAESVGTIALLRKPFDPAALCDYVERCFM